NVIVQDGMIVNEQTLIENNTTRKYTFGILCRFSREKRIEDTIFLINKLNLEGINASLIIQGNGDENYYCQLKELINKNRLQDFITIIKKNIHPANTHLFYRKISFFIITS